MAGKFEIQLDSISKQFLQCTASKMPRKYVRKGIKNKWSDSQLVAAKHAVQEGQLSIRGASIKFDIPRSTLHDHLSGTSSKRYGGPPTVLTASEEKEIVRTCLVMQEFGFPLDRDLVSRAVRDFLVARDRAGLFTNGIPGRTWWTGFFRRHPEMVERKPEHLPRIRAQAATPEVRKAQLAIIVQ